MKLKLKPKLKGDNPLKSKTNWVALVGAALAFIPGVGPWIATNPAAYAALIGVAVGLARNFKLLDD